jgi:hypothetical protein
VSRAVPVTVYLTPDEYELLRGLAYRIHKPMSAILSRPLAVALEKHRAETAGGYSVACECPRCHCREHDGPCNPLFLSW